MALITCTTMIFAHTNKYVAPVMPTVRGLRPAADFSIRTIDHTVVRMISENKRRFDEVSYSYRMANENDEFLLSDNKTKPNESENATCANNDEQDMINGRGKTNWPGKYFFGDMWRFFMR